MRQRIADLDATIASLEHKVRDNVGGILPFMVKTPLKLSQLAMAGSDLVAARDGTQQAVAGLRRGGTGDGSSAMARWTGLMWTARIFAPEDGAVDPCDSGVDMDDVDEEPDPDGSVWDEIPDPVLQFGDASSCVKYPRWLGRRA